MEIIREPDLDWFRRLHPVTTNAKAGATGELYGIWSAGNLDGWVGREGEMVRECLGGEEGGRVTLLEGIPHAFCLSKSAHVELFLAYT
jgi:hypothetical protein